MGRHEPTEHAGLHPHIRIHERGRLEQSAGSKSALAPGHDYSDGAHHGRDDDPCQTRRGRSAGCGGIPPPSALPSRAVALEELLPRALARRMGAALRDCGGGSSSGLRAECPLRASDGGMQGGRRSGDTTGRAGPMPRDALRRICPAGFL